MTLHERITSVACRRARANDQRPCAFRASGAWWLYNPVTGRTNPITAPNHWRRP